MMADPELEEVDTSHLVRELSAEQQHMLMAAAKKRDRGESLTAAETALLSDWEKPFPVEIRKDEA